MTGMLPGLATEADRRAAEPDKRDREDDPTPRELVRAIIEAAGPHIVRHCENPSRALDVCAGYGVWASEWRRWWVRSQWASVPLHITGVELCEARREHGLKWCDEWIARDWFDALSDHHELPRFDVAMGNPHFSALVGKRDREPSEVADILADPNDTALSMPAVLLEHAPAVLLFHQTTSFQRGRAGVAAWRAYPPDGGASWRWTVPPGSEEPSDDLPGVVRGDS